MIIHKHNVIIHYYILQNVFFYCTGTKVPPNSTLVYVIEVVRLRSHESLFAEIDYNGDRFISTTEAFLFLLLY